MSRRSLSRTWTRAISGNHDPSAGNGGITVKANKTKPAAGRKRGKVPAVLYVQLEERLNARWAVAAKERGIWVKRARGEK